MSTPAVSSTESRQASRKRNFKVLGAIAAAAALVAFGFSLFSAHTESTDDAFVEATMTTVAPQIDGRVLAVHFNDNAPVKAGDVLVEIDPADYKAAAEAARAAVQAARARIASAQANLQMITVTSQAERDRARKAVTGAKMQMDQAKFTAEAAEADTERAKSDTERYRRLFTEEFASKQKLEQVEAEYRADNARWQAAQAAKSSAEAAMGQASEQLRSASTIEDQIALREAELELARAQAAQAEAELATAMLNLSYTTITAPTDGTAAKRSVEVGDIVRKGQTMTYLIGNDPWVVANFKETQLAHMQPGQKAEIRVDSFPGVKLKGHVDSLQPGTGSRFSLLPPENATGNYVKVVQRVPVKIVLEAGQDGVPRLGAGMSVVPTVDTATP